MRLIDADELLIAMDTWDKFGYDEQERLIPIDNNDERYVPYVHYADMVKAVNGMPTIDARADAIKEVYDLTEKAIKHHADNFIQFGNGAGRRNGKIMGKWLFEYFIEMKIEAEKILEQLKEQTNDNDRSRNG